MYESRIYVITSIYKTLQRNTKVDVVSRYLLKTKTYVDDSIFEHQNFFTMLVVRSSKKFTFN